MHTVIRTIVATLAAVGLFMFFIPLLVANIVNVGNVTGMAVCAAVLTYMIFFTPINRLVLQLWSRSAGRIVFIVLGALLAVAVVLVIIITACMIATTSQQPEGDVTVVVLGCKVNGETPSLMLRERLDAAVSYLTEHPETDCVVSGGQGRGELISEAECMKRYLVANGIEEARIYKEDLSTSTRENLTFSREIIEQNGLERTAAIVTNEFHEYRAAVIAAELGMKTYAVPAATQLWLLPTYYVRELYGILYEWVV